MIHIGAWVVAASIVAGCGGSGGERSVPTMPTEDVPAAECPRPDECTTHELASSSDILLGAAVTAAHLDEDDYRDTLAEGFNSITPENELKWGSVHPEPDDWEFGPLDTIVDFAEQHDMAVKGHTLIWDQELIDSTPEWVQAIDDPSELRAVLRDHIGTLMTRYDGRIDRWDVVNEPLQTVGSEVYDNHFRQVLGDDYIAEAFRIADEIDPDARLFLNEATVEYLPPKADSLLTLVADLVSSDVPIDGVGLQTHLVGGAPAPGVISGLIAGLSALGVEVAITELDIPIDPDEDAAVGLERQADGYSQAVGECIDAGCREITVWGFTDRYTWIDDILGPDRDPLPYDADYVPKPAEAAIRERIRNVG